jgi:hypothetical protein
MSLIQKLLVAVLQCGQRSWHTVERNKAGD